MKSTTFAFFVGVYLVEYVLLHPGFKITDMEKEGENVAQSDQSKINSVTDRGLPDVNTDAKREEETVRVEKEKTNFIIPHNESTGDFHNLLAFEYLDKFNAPNAQNNQKEIDDYLAIQDHLADLDNPEYKKLNDGISSLSKKDLDEEENKRLEILKLLKEEFLKHYRESKGRWNALTKCTTGERIELCKAVYRRHNKIEKSFQMEEKFLSLMVLVEDREDLLVTDLLECTVSWKENWNGIVFPKVKVFYLAEGNSSTEVFNLSELNDHLVQIEGKIDKISYPHCK